MKKNSLNLVVMALTVLVAAMVTPEAKAQDQKRMGFQRYYERNEFLMASPGAMTFGLYGYDNPALLQGVREPDFMFSWTSDQMLGDITRWGLFTAFPNASFSFVNNDFADVSFREYRIALGSGSDSYAGGVSVNWYRGDTEFFNYKTHLTAGTIFRPSRYFSVGAMSSATFDFKYHELVLDLAIRPFGTPALALYGDYVLDDGRRVLSQGKWSAGAAVEA
ncbi:hypothetical protein QLX67_10275, partial [Balneolaceae bacterium ANBcel3]|nr:hypothetical protein [Balneolaceae bacterium ANBcel3]